MLSRKQWFECAKKGNVELLLEGSEVFSGMLDEYGRTALAVAALAGKEKAVRLLAPFEFIIAPDITLQCARQGGHPGIIAYLHNCETLGT